MEHGADGWSDHDVSQLVSVEFARLDALLATEAKQGYGDHSVIGGLSTYCLTLSIRLSSGGAPQEFLDCIGRVAYLFKDYETQTLRTRALIVEDARILLGRLAQSLRGDGIYVRNIASLDQTTFVVFDTETTGLSPAADRLVEIAAVKFSLQDGIQGTFHSLINPGMTIPREARETHGITDADVQQQPDAGMVLHEFARFAGGRESVLVAHNASFDMNFLHAECDRHRLPTFRNPMLCTLQLSRSHLPWLKNHKLATVAEHLGVFAGGALHRAETDCALVHGILVSFLDRIPHERVIEEIQRSRPGWSPPCDGPLAARGEVAILPPPGPAPAARGPSSDELLACYGRGRAALAVDNWESAIAEFEWLVEHAPGYEDAERHLGIARRRRKASKAVARARRYLTEGNAARALAVLQLVAKEEPSTPGVQELLAEVQRQLSLSASPAEGPRSVPPDQSITKADPRALTPSSPPPPEPPPSGIDVPTPAPQWPSGESAPSSTPMGQWLIVGIIGLVVVWLVVSAVAWFLATFGWVGILAVILGIGLIHWLRQGGQSGS